MLLGLLALPPMLRMGYDRRLAIGVICAGGSLGTMIPPSIVLISWPDRRTCRSAICSRPLRAGLPAGRALRRLCAGARLKRPQIRPACWNPGHSRRRKARLLLGRWGIVFMVLGSIYGGIASVMSLGREASSVALATIVRGEFTLKMLKERRCKRFETCGMIVWIGVGANSALVSVFNLMGGVNFVSGLITGISDNPTVIILVMMAILFVLGMFLDWVGIALLTIPSLSPSSPSLAIARSGSAWSFR